jgi:UTP--glucose-1-phosphate uridylyltransferase
MKAVIPAAGMGTRFLPLTKAQPKEMLPVLDKPAIQYVVEEAVAAGCDEVVLIVNEDKQAVRNHFAPAPKLDQYLQDKGKDTYLQKLQALEQLPVTYATQDRAQGLGHAVLCAQNALNEEHDPASATAPDSAPAPCSPEPFFVLLGDVLVPDNDVLGKMLEVSQAHGNASVIAVFEVPEEEVERFGIIDGNLVSGSVPDGDAVWKLLSMVEKPPLAQAPSHMAIFGRYLLSPVIFDCIKDTAPGAGGEIQLTDAMLKLLEKEDIYAVLVPGESAFDTGTVPSWLESNVRLALRDPKLAALIRKQVA